MGPRIPLDFSLVLYYPFIHIINASCVKIFYYGNYLRRFLMKKSVLVVVFAALCCMVAAPAAVSAAEVAATAYEMKSEATIKSILLDNFKKRVTLRLGSGESLEGYVSKVGDTLVQITRITGREYFDAIIRIDQISAVVFRVKEK
jgi:hypothetical protein